MLEGGRLRGLLSLLRNLVLAALLYACLFGTIWIAQTPSFLPSASHSSPPKGDPSGAAGELELLPEVVGNKSSSLKLRLAGTKKTVEINPHATVFNRPESAVLPSDDYLGSRPHADVVADIKLLVEVCRGSYSEEEKVGYVRDCLQFLAKEEEQYYSLPPKAERASTQSPTVAEFKDADGHGSTRNGYLPIGAAVAASNGSIGTCPGPVIPYHTYWTGPATWRVEIFIKSYLYTQNLACSRLHIWLDSDRDAKAAEDMLRKDPIFAQFLPLVERGDIVLENWNFPSRIPLPKGDSAMDDLVYYDTRGKPDSNGEFAVADGIIEDAEGQQWLKLSQKQMSFLPVAVSDAVRFIILHQYGGMYFDMDVLMLRDMRPLALAKERNWAERWGALQGHWEYNTAIMSLQPNSSLSSYLLRGAVRIGLNFHPRILGMMAWKDGRVQEFLKFETGAFDPIWTAFQSKMEGKCTVPCLKDYGAVFKGRSKVIKNEWESYEGPQLAPVKLNNTTSHVTNETQQAPQRAEMRRTRRMAITKADIPEEEPTSETPVESSMLDSFSTTDEQEAKLRQLGIVDDYIIEEDKYPPNNRTLQNFFRGAWTYHIHNQWSKHPEPSSWFDVIQKAHEGFFERRRLNPYGERWEGPDLRRYRRWPEFI